MSDFNTNQGGMKKIGRLYGVGVGPGDPELITLKAKRLLLNVPVIFVPRKSERSRSIAETIIGGLEPNIESKFVGIVMPMLRDKNRLQKYWNKARYHLAALESGTGLRLCQCRRPLNLRYIHLYHENAAGGSSGN